MIGVVYEGKVNYITRVEDFQELMEPNVYEAMVKAIDNGILTEDYKEKYEQLQDAYDELESDYEDLEYVEDELEEVKSKLLKVGKYIDEILKDIQWGYIDKKDDIVAKIEKISAEVVL